MNVAIISPNHKAYSETFIHAHKQIKANVYYYYGDTVPNHLEGFGAIKPKAGTFNRWKRKLWRRITRETLSVAEVEFTKSLLKNKIDVIFAEYGMTGAELLPVCKKLKMPLVTIFHGHDASIKQILEEYKIKYLDLFQYASKIIVVSEVMKMRLIALGCPSNKIVKDIYGPNNKFLEISPTFIEHKSFVAIGRFVNTKAPYYTILAIKKVVEKYPDILLYYAGQGELFETVQNIVNYYKLENNVKFLGVITPDEYVSLLLKVNGFLQHSVTSANGDMEGTPLAVLEASAAGIPVIATYHAGIPEVIIDGESGFLVKEHDVDGMAENIIRLIEYPELAKSMGMKGKTNIKNNFFIEKHLEIIQNILAEAIQSKNN